MRKLLWTALEATAKPLATDQRRLALIETEQGKNKKSGVREENQRATTKSNSKNNRSSNGRTEICLRRIEELAIALSMKPWELLKGV